MNKKEAIERIEKLEAQARAGCRVVTASASPIPDEAIRR